MNAVAVRWTIHLRSDGLDKIVVWEPAASALVTDDDELTGVVHATEQTVVILTNSDGFGDWLLERRIPWHRVHEYRAETFALPRRDA